jgi:hypothetical protein
MTMAPGPRSTNMHSLYCDLSADMAPLTIPDSHLKKLCCQERRTTSLYGMKRPEIRLPRRLGWDGGFSISRLAPDPDYDSIAGIGNYRFVGGGNEHNRRLLALTKSPCQKVAHALIRWQGGYVKGYGSRRFWLLVLFRGVGLVLRPRIDCDTAR